MYCVHLNCKSSKMADPSQTDSRRITVKKEAFSGPYALLNEETTRMEPLLQQSVERGNKEKQNSKLVQMSEAAESKEDSIRYLTADTFFDLVLTKTHVQPCYQVQLPARIVRELPKATVPVVLRYNCKNWNLSYVGNCRSPRFDARWKNFVNDNALKAGDACVFELMECNPEKIRFKVHILRGDLPPELAAAVETHGTKGNPIEVD